MHLLLALDRNVWISGTGDNAILRQRIQRGGAKIVYTKKLSRDIIMKVEPPIWKK